MNAFPPVLRDDGGLAFISTRDAFQFLDHAVRLNNETPDGSVIKFAVASISANLKDSAVADVFQYVLNLAWYYPILLPYLEQIDAVAAYYEKDQLIEKLIQIIKVNVLHRRSDGICWALYYLERLGGNPTDDSIAGIIDSKDCVAITMLCNFAVALDRVAEYATQQLITANLYTKDQYWLLLYQLYRMNKIADPYAGEGTFELLKRYDVDFFCPPNESSRAEGYCSLISNPFIEEKDIPTFENWMQAKEEEGAL